MDESDEETEDEIPAYALARTVEGVIGRRKLNSERGPKKTDRGRARRRRRPRG
jgi:hypothetical protein